MTINNWIEQHYDILKDKYINDIIMPGTHDSGAYHIDFNKYLDNTKINMALRVGKVIPYAKKIISNWTMTQDKSIYDQLKAGIRCLDLRFSYDPNKKKYYITHSFVLMYINDAIQQINQFLRETTKEVIIITISSDWTYKDSFDGSHLLYIFQSLLNTTQITRQYNTISNMISANKRVLILENFNAPWIDTESTKTKYDFLINAYLNFMPPGYNILAFTITPQVKNIINGVFHPTKNIENLSENIHAKYYDFLKLYPKPINTCSIMFDFPTDELIADVIRINFI